MAAGAALRAAVLRSHIVAPRSGEGAAAPAPAAGAPAPPGCERLSVTELPELRLELFDVGAGRSRLARITLNNPKALNAISGTMLGSFNKALATVENRKHGVRCLVITGEGRGFSSGANIGERPKGGKGHDPWRDVFPVTAAGDESDRPGPPSVLVTKYHPLMLRLRDLPMPIVAAVAGPCAGVGMSFALAADMIIAADDAFFLQPFRDRGLVPDGGATYLLPRKVGWSRGLEMAMLGERLPAAKAAEWGLVKEVVPRAGLGDGSLALAARLAVGPTRTLAATRKAYWASFRNSYEEQLALEAELQGQVGRSADAREGGMAFFQKREPQFTGR